MSRKDCRSLPGRGGAALRLRVLLAHFAPGIRRSLALSLSLGAGHPQACSSIIWAPGPGVSAADRLVILSPLLHLGLSTPLEMEGWGRSILLQAGKGARSVEATGPAAWQERPGTPWGQHAVLVGRGGSAGSRPTPRVPAGFPLHVGVGVGVGTEAGTRPDLKAESVSPAFLSLRLRLARPGVAFLGERRFTGHQEPSCPRGPSALPGVRPPACRLLLRRASVALCKLGAPGPALRAARRAVVLPARLASSPQLPSVQGSCFLSPNPSPGSSGTRLACVLSEAGATANAKCGRPACFSTNPLGSELHL